MSQHASARPRCPAQRAKRTSHNVQGVGGSLAGKPCNAAIKEALQRASLLGAAPRQQVQGPRVVLEGLIHCEGDARVGQDAH